jgi:hypothetical protein
MTDRPRTRGYDPTWRIFEGGTGFAPHPWSLTGPGMIRLPAYATVDPYPALADMTAALRPEMLDIGDAAPFLPGEQPTRPLLPALDHKAIWERPPATPRLALRLPLPPGRRTRARIGRQLAAGVCGVTLVLVALAATLPAIHASQRTAPAEIAPPLIAGRLIAGPMVAAPERIPEAAIGTPAGPAAVRVILGASLSHPAADALPDRLDLALPAQPDRPGRTRPKAVRRIEADRETRHTARHHAVLIGTAAPRATAAFSREVRFVISYPDETTQQGDRSWTSTRAVAESQPTR